MKQVLLLSLLAQLAASAESPQAPTQTLILIAGTPNHAPGTHEHNAGMTLLTRAFAGFAGRHLHTHWGNDNFCTGLFNALAGINGHEVYAVGIQSGVSAKELAFHLEPK